MNSKAQFVAEEGPVSHMEYEDGSAVLAADVGIQSDASVDVVGDTVIVVTDDDQYELEVPATGDDDEEASAQAFINNGVLTVEVNA